MKRLAFFLVFTTMTFLSFGLAHGVSVVVLESMTGLISGDTVGVDSSVKWDFRLTFTPGDGDTISGFSNGFRIWTHSGGVNTDNFTPITYDTFSIGWVPVIFDGGFFFVTFPDPPDGIGADTIGFGGFATFLSGASGILDGFDTVVWWIETTPSANGDTLCIDSSWHPPQNKWLWSTQFSQPDGLVPDWGGPYCYHVYDPSTDIKVLGGPDLPTTYALSQNYPNPFNPTTEINFDVPVRSRVTLTVFNVVGQKVTTLVDKELAPNRYIVDWNGTADNGAKVASGVYFYKLEAGDFVETKKMMFLK